MTTENEGVRPRSTAVAVGMASGARTAATITVQFRTASNVGVSAVSLVDADADVLAAAAVA